MTQKEKDAKRAELVAALAELDKLQPEPEIDYSKWEGRMVSYSDDDPECPARGITRIFSGYDANKAFTFVTSGGNAYRYARLATYAELGLPWVEGAERLLERIADTRGLLEDNYVKTEARRILALRDGVSK